jgi:hypothetical protein
VTVKSLTYYFSHSFQRFLRCVPKKFGCFTFWLAKFLQSLRIPKSFFVRDFFDNCEKIALYLEMVQQVLDIDNIEDENR